VKAAKVVGGKPRKDRFLSVLPCKAISKRKHYLYTGGCAMI